MTKRAWHAPAIAITTLLGMGSAHAGGFALIEQGASGLGTSYAGASAVSSDTSTVWFNPAGMLELESAEFASAFHLIAAQTEFNDRGTTLNPVFGLGSVSGKQSDGIDSNTFVPNIYYVRPFGENMAYGLGISVPFGNSTEYDRTWVGRYQAVESGVTVIDINPSFAYRINDKFNVGGGISVQFMSATLGSAIDSSAICLSILAGDFNQCTALNLAPPGSAVFDSYAEIEGESTELTFNLGVLYKPMPSTKLGVAYRHGADHDLDGDATFELNENLAQLIQTSGAPILQNGDASALARLPASLMFSGAHQLNEKIQLLADATWMQWSVFEELRVVYDNPAQPDTLNTQKWNDVWRVSAGLNYSYNDALTLKSGIAYDQDPIPSPKRRTARIPGNDRTWLSFGLNYALNKSISFDFGYAHLFVDETPIDNASESEGGTTIRGTYDVAIDIVSAQLNWQFN